MSILVWRSRDWFALRFVSATVGGNGVVTTVRVFVCDDHPIVVDGLSWLFGKNDCIDLVGVAGWGPSTVSIIAQANPDVLFFDHRQLHDSCVLAADVRRSLREVKFIVFSAGVTVMETMQALDQGAAGVVLKSSPLHVIEEAVRRVAAGDNFLDEGIARNLAFYAGRSLANESYPGL
jgi:DNA-binding NarL/FixJ family response regulator